MKIEDLDMKLGNIMNKIPNILKLFAGLITLCSIGFAICNPYRMQAEQIEKQNKEHLTARISFMQPYGSKSDSVIAELVFSNQSDKIGYISETFLQRYNVPKSIPAIDFDTKKQPEWIKVSPHADLPKKYLFNLGSTIKQNKLFDENDYPLPDTYFVGILAHYTSEKDSGKVIRNILIYTKNGKVTGTNLSDSKEPVIIIDK